MKDNNFFVRFWKNQRSRSALFLLLWLVFIGYVIVTYAIPYEKGKVNNTNNEVNVEEDYDEAIYFEDLKNSLQKYNFDYIYTVNINNEKIIYKGTMLGNETSGYKESVLGIEKYYIVGTQIYKEVLGERILVTDKDTNVYNGYLSIDKIMEMIFEKEYTKSENEYTFQIDAIYVKMRIANDNIVQIEIVDGNNNYLLEFSNVNEIKELNY